MLQHIDKTLKNIENTLQHWGTFKYNSECTASGTLIRMLMYVVPFVLVGSVPRCAKHSWVLLEDFTHRIFCQGRIWTEHLHAAVRSSFELSQSLYSYCFSFLKFIVIFCLRRPRFVASNFVFLGPLLSLEKLFGIGRDWKRVETSQGKCIGVDWTI